MLAKTSGLFALVAVVGSFGLQAADFYISPSGADVNPGTTAKPFATLGRARDAVRASGKLGKEAVTVHALPGVYYLPETLVFTSDDSGSEKAPVTYQGDPGGEVVVSGGLALDLAWELYKEGILQAKVPAGLEIDQLFINGVRQIMARYPNYDPDQRMMHGYAADAFSKERAARWSDPAGGYMHAMHPAHWGDVHFQIIGKKPDGSLDYEGGWQNNRGSAMHQEHRFVENIFEELDAPGEWFHRKKTGLLYYFPTTGTDLKTAKVEVVRLRHLIDFKGQADKPVKYVTLRGLTFRHAARTFMDNREPLNRSDWTTYRGGAVFTEGTEDCDVIDCTFDQVGGNTVFVNAYNRRFAVRGCLIQASGANGVAFVGDAKAVRSPLLNYGQPFDYAKVDRTPGPLTINYPADCLVEDCLITRTGWFERQTAPVQISMAMGITVRHCSIYDVPRAGINISEGCWGGHVIEFCDIFDTVKETGDHGSFNSWGRDRYWHPDINIINEKVAAEPALPSLDMLKTNILRNNRWRCDHGWDIDLDDGSSNYEIYNNLCLNGGIKNREGYRRVVTNNIMVNNSFHPHVWLNDSGDVFKRNIVMGAYRPAGGMPQGKWGQELDYNFFTTSDADRTRFAGNGCDAHSLAGDPKFVDPATGNFQVKEDSPALMVGFKNFAMDQFGVQKPLLKAMARTPIIPTLAVAKSERKQEAPLGLWWLQARVRTISGDEFSAFGVSKESGGIHMAEVPAGSLAAQNGFQKDDLIQSINGQALRTLRDLFRLRDAAAGKPLTVGFVRAQQAQTCTVVVYEFTVSESAQTQDFLRLPLRKGASIIRSVLASPEASNEPVATLKDGLLAANYGPVFGNGVKDGLYKADLGLALELGSVCAWSYNMGGKRGSQRYVLFVSDAKDDPGWSVNGGKMYTPLATVDSPCSATFHATRVAMAGGKELGTYRWLVWAVAPVTDIEENTAYQEFQVIPF